MKELIEKIKALPSEYHGLFISNDNELKKTEYTTITTDDLKQLVDRLERVETALKHYANHKNWDQYPKSMAIVVVKGTKGIGWSIAQEALSPVAGEKK